MQAIPTSGIRRFFDLLENMDGVISLGVGQPDFVTPGFIRDAAIQAIEDGQTHYTSNSGLIELRQAIADQLFRLYDVSYDASSELIVTTGVSEGLAIAMQSILDHGDEVLCPDPGYVAYLPSVVLAGGVFVPVPTTSRHDFKLLPRDLEAQITPRTKAILIGYPANPTGAVMTREELEAVAAVAKRHNLFIVSDEIYARLVYGSEHVCVSSLDDVRDQTILLGGFSKAYAMTGWRLGFVAAPQHLVEAMMKVHQYVIMSAPTAAQYAAIAAIKDGEEDVRGMVGEYDRRRRLLVDGLNELGLTCFEPKGAFYAFPSVGVTGLSDETFAETLLLEERVAVVPGSAFGQFGAGHVRMCYAQSYELIEEALERMRRFVGRHHRR